MARRPGVYSVTPEVDFEELIRMLEEAYEGGWLTDGVEFDTDRQKKDRNKIIAICGLVYRTCTIST